MTETEASRWIVGFLAGLVLFIVALFVGAALLLSRSDAERPHLMGDPTQQVCSDGEVVIHRSGRDGKRMPFVCSDGKRYD